MTELTQRRQELHLEWRETPERLISKAMNEGCSIMRYGQYYLMTGWSDLEYRRPEEEEEYWYAAVYEQLDDGKMDPETDLALAEISPGFFQDEGHAIEWAINTIK